jgi:hypothetical protein
MRISSKIILATSIFICCLFSSCNSSNRDSIRKSTGLSGEWQLILDSTDRGLAADCRQEGFSDLMQLPGTLDENKKGRLNQSNELNHLHRKYMFTGSAWYRKQVDIPKEWKGKRIQLLLERSKVTQVWLDTNYIGSCALLSSSQLFDLVEYAQPGKHWLTIRVNNDPALVPIEGSHAYSEDTQTNWNGILGKIELQAIPKIHIQSVKLASNIALKNFQFSIVLVNPSKMQLDGSVKVKAELWNAKVSQKAQQKSYKLILKPEADAHLNVTFPLGGNAQEWSEFSPNLYKFKFSLYDSRNQLINEYEVNSGYREFKTSGTQFTINGLKIFLRGKHDGCVFPLTGHPPMDTASWAKLFRIAQTYGINHYRFHSWCPPEAAFLAADATGMYLQPELPNWKSFEENDSQEHLEFQRNEGIHLLEEYGNHPSLVMLSLGNELGGSRNIMKNLLDEFRSIDPEILYAQGSNNFFWDPAYAKGDDYWTTDFTGKPTDNLSTDVRGSFSFADSKSAGWINSIYPGTNSNYTRAISYIDVPVIGHEVGQYLVFPDFSEIPKYTGILEARNLEEFKKKLEASGLFNQVNDFHKASGALAAICYREEIEKAMRTPNFGGFHLLDLQDYPGQGTALVGLLDAFMQSKGIISASEFHSFCNSVVPLAIFEKYCWTSAEVFKAEIDLANYSNTDLIKNKLHWIIQDAAGAKILDGNFNANSQKGSLTKIGNIALKLDNIKGLQRLQLILLLEGTNVQNKYYIWLYPENIDPPETDKIPIDLLITKQIDDKTIAQLKAGGKVLFVPEHNKIIDKSVGGLFITDFWNYGMFKSIAESQKKQPSPGTMGILVNPSNPLFQNFPSENHSDWQWWIIAKNSRPFILDNSPAGYIPIVQVIDNFERNHKLGILFEFAVGKGKLLVSTTDLSAILAKPEGRQYYQAILMYASSENFKPLNEISIIELQKMFK